MPLAPGDTLGRYQLRSRVGGGAMGVVWLAHDPALERRVALKLIAPGLADDEDFRARFLREARAAAAIDHPHVLPVYEAGTADGQLFLAMRYVPGVDLATQLARSGPLGLQATLRLVDQLGAALDAAHAAGVIHRDLKPANVLLADGDHAYLADFGLARSAAAVGLTRPGQLVGTAAYTAPELLRGEPAAPASDTYALACLAVECLTGQPPFSADDEMATLYAHAHAPPPALVERNADLPPALQAVVERGLAKDPSQRYPSPRALAEALRAAAGAGAAGVERSSRGSDLSKRPSRTPGARIGLAAAVTAGVLTIATFVWFGAADETGQAPGTDETLPSALPVAVATPNAEGRIDPVQLAPGRYSFANLSPRVTFTVDGDQWWAYRDYPDAAGLLFMAADSDPRNDGPVPIGGIDFDLVQVVFTGPCSDAGTRVLAATPASIAAWLEERTDLETGSPSPVNVAGYSGISVELTPADDEDPCPEDGPVPVTWLFPVGDDLFHILPGERLRFIALDVQGRSFAILPWWGDGSFSELEDHLDSVLGSLAIEP